MGCPPRLLRETSPAFAQSGAGSSVTRFDKATPLTKIGKDLGQGAWLLCDEIYLGLLALWKQRCWLKSEKPWVSVPGIQGFGEVGSSVTATV